MNDRILCPGGDCPQKRQCLRHRRRAHGRRAAFAQPPYDPGSGQCASFIDIDTLAPTPEQIRGRAYRLWQDAGEPDGLDVAHWQQAEAELNAAFLEGLTE